MLYMNWTAGKQGFQQYRTVVTFEISNLSYPTQVVHLGELEKNRPIDWSVEYI